MKLKLICLAMILLSLCGCGDGLKPTDPLTPVVQFGKQVIITQARVFNAAALADGKESVASNAMLGQLLDSAQSVLDTENKSLAAGDTVSAQQQQAFFAQLILQVEAGLGTTEAQLVTSALTATTQPK